MSPSTDVFTRAAVRLLARRRRSIAAGLAALSVACVLAVLRPGPPPTVAVLAAARDLPGGVLSAHDVQTVALPPGAVPDGSLRPGTEVAGRVLAAPARRGEPLTDVRLLGPDLLAPHPPGTVATPIRVADPGAARLLSSGDVIDVLATATGWEESGASAAVVAAAVTVLSVLSGDPEGGTLVVLATTGDQAARLAAAQPAGRLSIAIHPRRAPP
jgi:pilus assembly protein CpaB